MKRPAKGCEGGRNGLVACFELPAQVTFSSPVATVRHHLSASVPVSRLGFREVRLSAVSSSVRLLDGFGFSARIMRGRCRGIDLDLSADTPILSHMMPRLMSC